MSYSGVGGVGQYQYQSFQLPAAQPGQQSPISSASSSSDSTTAQAQIQLQLQLQRQQQLTGSHHRHHGGGHKGGSGVQNLMDTIQQALEQASSTSNPNQVIENTVAQLLSGNGTTTDSSGTSIASTTDPTAAVTNSQSTTAQSFFDFLKSKGVDMRQFRADLVAAVKDAQNGQVNSATALKSLPAGSAVDLSA